MTRGPLPSVVAVLVCVTGTGISLGLALAGVYPEVSEITSTFLQFNNVTFYYDSMDSAVFDRLSLRLYTGWTGIIGANGSGKTTLLQLGCDELKPQRGSIRCGEDALYCAQATDDPPPELPRFLLATDTHACSLRGRLGVESDWEERWLSLSHGERKRVQIAVALWLQPAVFAVDEPTNHIDIVARRLLGSALQSFRGVGLLVSHDRELLDSLCRQCLVLDPPRVVLRPGGYSKAAALGKAEKERARQMRGQAKREVETVRREAADRAHKAAQADRKRSKRHLSPKESSARERIDVARLLGKDGKAGRLLSQLEGRLRQAEEKLKNIRVEKEHPMGIRMRGEPIRRSTLFGLPSGTLRLGPARQLAHPQLSMGRNERIALIGPNGSGKSTLVRHILGKLDLPHSG